MRTRLLTTTACWLALTALLPAQPINPDAAVQLPTYTVPAADAESDAFGGPGAAANPTFYLSFENLFWWTKPNNLDRAIVSSLRNPGVDYASSTGAGGQADPNAYVIYGNQRIDQDIHWGFRGTAQIGFDDMNAQVIELVGMYLPRSAVTDRFDSTGIPALALLYNDVSGGFPGTQTARPIAGVVNGNTLSGGIVLDTYSELWGAEFNLVHRFTDRHSPYMADVLIGYRHQGLNEGFAITAGRPGDAFEDSFSTRNFFNGGQVGMRVGAKWWHFVVQVSGKAALGATDQELSIATQNYGNGTSSLYDQFSNFGKTSSTRLGFIGEAGASFTWSIHPNVSFSGGYNYMYWNRVARPTDQIDANINLNQAAGVIAVPNNPLRREQRSEFWAHGATFAIELMF